MDHLGNYSIRVLFVICGLVLPLLINFNIARKNGKNAALIIFLTLLFSWFVTLFLICHTSSKLNSDKSIAYKELKSSLYLFLAGLASLGIGTGDPTNPKLFAVLFLLLCWIASGYAYVQRRKNLINFVVILIVLSGVFSLVTHKSLWWSTVNGEISLELFFLVFLLNGGGAAVLAILAFLYMPESLEETAMPTRNIIINEEQKLIEIYGAEQLEKCLSCNQMTRKDKIRCIHCGSPNEK